MSFPNTSTVYSQEPGCMLPYKVVKEKHQTNKQTKIAGKTQVSSLNLKMSEVPVLTWWAPSDPHPQRGVRKQQMTSSDGGYKVGFGDERSMGASEERKKGSHRNSEEVFLLQHP